MRGQGAKEKEFIVQLHTIQEKGFFKQETVW